MEIRAGRLRQLVREALKKSDAKMVGDVLQMAAGKVNARVVPTVDSAGGTINVFMRLLSGDPDAAQQAMEAAAADHGWSLLSKSERRGTVWWFEPGPSLKRPVTRTKLPDVLYHVTPAQNVPGILANGLEPRRRQYALTTRTYAPRVYLATSPKAAQSTINREDDWVLLKVDRRALPKGQKFYVDQEFGVNKQGLPAAVYTLDPVPAGAIERA